jgi:hypothetical protein
MQLNLIDSLLFSFYGFFTKTATIGVSNEITKEKRQGIITGKDKFGNHTTIPFTVDRPEVLVKPNLFTVVSLFQQIEQLGIKPTYIEIGKDQKRYLYRYGVSRPVFAQA